MRLVFLSVVVLSLWACDSSIGRTCGVDNPAVSRARSFSPQQLEFLHAEMYRLRQAGSNLEYGVAREQIPQNLAFLDAARIRPGRGLRPNVMLDGCMDEYVLLDFYGPEDDYPGDSPSRVVLTYSGGSATLVESEVLWEATRDESD